MLRLFISLEGLSRQALSFNSLNGCCIFSFFADAGTILNGGIFRNIQLCPIKNYTF